MVVETKKRRAMSEPIRSETKTKTETEEEALSPVKAIIDALHQDLGKVEKTPPRPFDLYTVGLITHILQYVASQKLPHVILVAYTALLSDLVKEDSAPGRSMVHDLVMMCGNALIRDLALSTDKTTSTAELVQFLRIAGLALLQERQGRPMRDEKDRFVLANSVQLTKELKQTPEKKSLINDILRQLTWGFFSDLKNQQPPQPPVNTSVSQPTSISLPPPKVPELRKRSLEHVATQTCMPTGQYQHIASTYYDVINHTLSHVTSMSTPTKP